MEEGYIKFQQGRFGLTCGSDEKKKQLTKYKASLRRLISQEPDAYWRQIYYLRHKRTLHDIDETVPKLIEPQLVTDVVVNRNNNKFNRTQLLQSKIDRDNATLLADIHKIHSRKYLGEENPLMQFMTNRNWKKRMMCTLRIGLENCAIYKRLQEIKPSMESREDYARWYKEVSKYRLLASKFPPYWNTRLCAPFEEVAWQRARDVPNPIVYLDIEVVGKAIGRVAFKLQADVVPMTAENFRSLCTGDRGKSYRCTEITIILNGLLWQGGDGLTSIYGESFPNENYKIKHDSEGTLSMVSFGEKTTNSEFRISAIALPPLDKKQVAFGKVILGMEYLRQMGRLAGVNERGKPLSRIVITGCGETTEEELMTLEPPQTLLEEKIGVEMEKLETKKKKEADEPYKGEYDDIPVTSSYTDLNAPLRKVNEEGAKGQGQKTAKANPGNSGSGGGRKGKK